MICLVNSPSRNRVEKHYARSSYPRLSLAYLAGYLRNRGIDCRVIDARFSGLNFNQTLERIIATQPRMIGFTAMTPEINDAVDLAQEIKRVMPHVAVVVGGAHMTALPEETLKQFPVIDYGIVGEGEEALFGLYNSGKSLSCPLDDLDGLPFPAWDLFPKSKVYPIIASRGCPFKCNFCMRVNGNRTRRHSPERIVEDIKRLINDFGAQKIIFHDETFGLNKAWTHHLLDLMMNLGIKWEATTRVDVADYELFHKMQQAGCCWMALGIESGNAEILRNTQKGITLPQVEHAVRLAKRAGLMVGGLFIMGHPYETRETIKDTIDFACRLPLDTVSCGLMVPYPGTEVAAMVKRDEGNYRLLSYDWRDYNKQVGRVLEMKDISHRELELLQLRLYLRFYLFHPKRIITLLRVLGWRALWSGLRMVLS